MQLTDIEYQNDFPRDVYSIARVIFAETCGQSLRVVEAMASLIANGARANK